METESYKIAIEAELTEVTHMLEEIASRDPQDEHNWVPKTDDMPADEADAIDVADKTEAWVERTGEVAQLERRYNDLRHALDRIAKGTYGICEISGHPIETARLEANLAARTCIAHKEEEGILS
ncbi:hypothetical protein A3C87_00840 [Candidatus Kaiserbacteria bacterium RIFCSPHIGHO2_02_FULL_49_34]|uniref:Uncharacterized protein n=1 Tax=Candidatus Kaiserbacteria bacterium RIFCSPHIGHO2_02_FULL_49_34 TaxID=1798491 RepID=A0A1F6DKS3_9BACT|nr:MAG: hypothetical protein A3C87_00840 [Candidatus Kaiserbacteria bacterium RIFCSPHIGHO2_02_FULL_49_34]